MHVQVQRYTRVQPSLFSLLSSLSLSRSLSLYLAPSLCVEYTESMVITYHICCSCLPDTFSWYHIFVIDHERRLQERSHCPLLLSYDGALSYRPSAFFIRLTIRELKGMYVRLWEGRERILIEKLAIVQQRLIGMHVPTRPNGQRGLNEAFRCVGAKNKKVIVDWVSTVHTYIDTYIDMPCCMYACMCMLKMVWIWLLP